MKGTMLRYPGGKSVALKHMLPYFPTDWNHYIEPFIGGGSVFLHLKQKYPNRMFWINDKYKVLVDFWKMLRDNPGPLVEYLLIEKNNSDESKKHGREVFEGAKHEIMSDHAVKRVASFYILNKCSFSGLTESSSYAPQAFVQNFSVSCIKRLLEYQPLLAGVRITNWSYEKILEKSDADKCLGYFDPPYDLGSCYLYGKRGNMHSGFDHESFSREMHDVNPDFQWIISYNDTERIRDWYKNYRIQKLSWKYTMRVAGKDGEKGRTGKRGNEILIFSDNIKKTATQQELGL